MLAFLLFSFAFVGFSQNDDEPCEFAKTKRAVTPAMSHDFGVVAKGTVVEHQFKVVNHGNVDMNITSFEVPQGMEVKMTSKTVKAKSEATFTIIINTKNFDKGFQSVVTLKTDSPKNAAIKYTIEGTVK